MQAEAVDCNTEEGKEIDNTALIIEHLELGYKLAWKLLGSWQARLPEDDVRSIVGIAICEAAKNYDGRPGVKFPTFLFYYLRGRLLREITKNVKYKKLTSKVQEEVSGESNFHKLLFEPDERAPMAYEANNPEKIMIDRERDDLLDKALAALDGLERDVVVRYYVNGQAILSIADELGYCRCHLSRVKSRAIGKLKQAVYMQHKAAENGKAGMSTEDMISMAFQGYSGGRGRRKKNRVKSSAATLTKMAA